MSNAVNKKTEKQADDSLPVSASLQDSEHAKKTSAAFARTVMLLEEISSHGPLRFAQLEERLQLPKASLHRSLNDLISERFVRFDEQSLTYRAGYRVVEIANNIWSGSDIRELAHDQLQLLANACNETVQLAVLADTQVVNIASIEARQNIRISVNVGDKCPVYCTGIGKVMLAMTSAAVQRDVIQRISFAEYTPQTITDPGDLMADLALIGKQGYAIEKEEHFVGLWSVAAPVLDSANAPVAALGVSVPAFRANDVDLQYWSTLVRQCAQTVSRRLMPVSGSLQENIQDV